MSSESRLECLVGPYSSPPRRLADQFFLLEEKTDLALGRLRPIRAVNEIFRQIQAVVAANRAGSRAEGIGDPHHRAHHADRVRSLDDHHHDRPTRNKIN